jgi:multimeric flavodoxin WrbA
MAKILGIAGSPHINGNTTYSIQYALNHLANNKHETKFISLANLKISPCIGCFNCQKGRKCIFDDDMNGIYEALRWCDVLVLGSPVYMGMVSGQLKVMMDRCVLFRPSYERNLELEGKIGCGIACGGFRNGGQESTLQNMHTFFLQQNMKVINDGFPFSHAGATIVDKAENDDLGLKTIENMMGNIEKALK